MTLTLGIYRLSNGELGLMYEEPVDITQLNKIILVRYSDNYRFRVWLRYTTEPVKILYDSSDRQHYLVFDEKKLDTLVTYFTASVVMTDYGWLLIPGEQK